MNSKYFRTVSILMIIFGALGLISGISMLSAAASWTLASAIINLVNSLLLIVAGVIGTKAVKTGDDAQSALCKKFSYALIGVAVVSIVVSLIGSANATAPGLNPGLVMGMTIIGSIISLALPLLYFFGAKKLGE